MKKILTGLLMLALLTQAAFQFLYDHKAIAFLKDCYEIEHTLSFDDAVEDMERICANNGGVLA